MPISSCWIFSTADGPATLSVLTAASVRRIVEHLPAPPKSWIVAGGSARSPTLMRMLAERLKPTPVETPDTVALNGLPLAFPSTTGVARPMPGGIIAQA